jgi:hypothetical protein
MSSRYFVEVPALEQCREETRSLWLHNLASCTEMAATTKLDLGYLANPASRGSIALLRTVPEAEIVGVQGLHPRVFHLGPTRISAANLADFAVSTSHRSLGPALMLMRHAMASAAARFDLVYGLPNAKSAAVCRRAGLRSVGTIQRFAKPLRSRSLLARRIHPGLAAVLAPLVDIGLQLRDAWRQRAGNHPLSCREASFDDPAIDAIWARRSNDLLLSERSASMLRWRYGLPGRGDWRITIAEAPDKTPVGYVVWQLQGGLASASDFFSTAPHAQTAALMSAFGTHARQQGADVVSVLFFGLGAVSEALRQADFSVRGQDALVFVGHASPDIAAVDPATRWYTTGFDNDAD